jgi:hypothetical protein
MVAVDKKNRKGYTPSDKNAKTKNVKFNDQKNKTEKSPFEVQNDKLREAILSLGGTKGDIKYLENIDTETSDNLVTDGDEKTEVTKFAIWGMHQNLT